MRILHIGNDEHAHFPSKIGLLTNLEELYIWNATNKIQAVPQEISKLTRLKKIVGIKRFSEKGKAQLEKFLPKVKFPNNYNASYENFYDEF